MVKKAVTYCCKHSFQFAFKIKAMKKKIVLIAAAGLLTTATIVAATSVNTGKKRPDGKAVKTEVVKEKKTTCNRERTHCFD